MMENFTNNQLVVDDLPNWEEINFEKVSASYRYVILLRYALILLIFVAGVALFGWLNDEMNLQSYFPFLLVGSIFIVAMSIFNLISFKRWGYALREKDVAYRAGIFSKTTEIVPYSKIQHVQVKEGIVSRFFGLASIEVFTAGMGKSLKIEGVTSERSVAIQQFVSSQIMSKSEKNTTVTA